MIEITFDLRRDRKHPYYVQLYQYIRNEIEEGRILPGTRLPPIRGLSHHLGISRNTVETAYLQLAAEGYVESRPRSGLYVAQLEQQFSALKTPIRRETCKQTEVEVGCSTVQATPVIRYDFQHGSVDLRYFPSATWNKMCQQTMREQLHHFAFHGNPRGEKGLRIQLTRYLRHYRGVHCSPEQVVIGAGTQQLLTLLCGLIGQPQDAAVEDPGYNGAKAVFSKLHFPIIPIPLENDGINVELLKQSRAKLVYITPSHQFPLGMVLPIHKRLQLLHWASEHNGLIIEDDYDSEFRYHGRPIPSLQGIDTKGRVVYLGTFSKAFLSSIRVSYMVLPEPILSVLKTWETVLEPTASLIHTYTLERFIAEGGWEKHLRRMKTVYRKKHAYLLSLISHYLGSKVKVIGQNSGLHVALEVGGTDTESELIQKAANVGVKVYPVSQYWVSPVEPTAPRILLGFGGLSENELEEGMRLLRNAWL